MNGQLWDFERETLFNEVRKAKPDRVFEVGTWMGGGSTWQIAEALKENGKGILITCEPHKPFWEEASALFATRKDVFCLNQTSKETIQYLDEQDLWPDFVFFDGPEDPNAAKEDLVLIEKHMRFGSTFMMHDWFNPPSVKADKIKPYLETSLIWRIEAVYGPPQSVGLVVAKRI